jgi:tetratricopeptide (TPR) repeat protein
VGDEKSSAIYAQLYKSMIEIAEESNRQFDPVLWTFTLGANQQSNQGDDAESSADYSFALDLIRFFKTDIISNRRYSLLDKQEAAENFFTYIGELRDQLAKDSNPATIEKRRSVVEELENTVAEMEKVLRLSIPVYNIRNVLLEIQQAGFSQRINTIEYDRIAAARKQHRIIASHFGIGGSFVESFAKMVKDYVDSDSTEKENALLQVQQIAKDFETMDLKNAQIVMSDYRISSAIELLPAKDPVLEIYAALLDRYLFLYIEDSQQDVDLYFETLVNVCRDRISKWSSDGENEKLFEFYEVYLRNAVLTSRTQNDKSVLLEELRNIAIAAIKLDKPEIAEEIWSASNAICETIIQARPWDFYIHQAQFGLCFEAAKEWNALKNQENTQRWLRRGWESYRLFSGDSIDLASVAVLPQRGENFENLDPDAQRFFDGLKPVSKGGVPNTVQSVPCDFSGKMFPLKTYVIPGKTSFQQLKNQLRWVDEYRGGKPDPTYVAIIDRLGAEANEMGLDFKTHFDRNFTKLLATEKNRSLLEVLSIEAMRRATGDSTQDETILPKTLQIFESLIGSSIASSNWAQLEHQSRRLLSRDGSNKNASVALAFSLFAQERVADSISILKTDWPDNKGAIGNIVRAYVGNDERGTSFSRLYRIADENNVSFPDLMEYALSTEIEKERKKENRLEQATKAKEELSELSNINQSGNNDESIADASLRSSDLIGRLITIADRAMFAEDWDQAIEVSKDILNYKPDDLDAKSKLAISYMMNRQEALAQEIIDRIWDVFQENMSGAEHLLMYRNSIKAAGLNYNSSIIAGVSSHPDDLFSLQYGLDPDTSLHTIRLIVSNEDGKFQWYVFECKRGYDRKVADQISGYSPRFIAETWAWDKILVYGKFLQQGIDSSPPSVESILKGFSNPERLPEIRDALILNRSPSSEYFSAIWNLQRWQQRVKLIELNQKLSGYDEQIFNKQESDRQLKRRFNTASFKALFLERWDESEAWARKVLEIDPDYLYGLGNLANSFLYRGRYNEAIEIYREHWDKDDDGDSFGSFIVDDFERLKDAGITHPDTQRVLMELPTPKPRQP